jgi:hypothetical protein
VQVELTEDQVAALSDAAARIGCSVDQLVRRAVQSDVATPGDKKPSGKTRNGPAPRPRHK